MDWLGFAQLPAFVVAGWLCSAQNPEATRLVIRGLVGLTFGLLIGLAGTGFAYDSSEYVAAGHRVLGHVVVTVATVSVLSSVGVLAQRGLRRQPIRCIARISVAVFAFAACLVASFTGYLKPSDPQIEPENFLRFQVIHKVVLPVVSAASVAFWFLLFRKGSYAGLSINGAAKIQGIAGETSQPLEGRYN
jgi:hypothetical protein